MTTASDYANANRGPTILVVLWALTSITTIIVIARLLIRAKVIRNFGVDDYLIAVSTILSLAYCAITTANVMVGYGRHQKFLSTSALETALLLNTVSFVFGILSFTLPKLAVAALLNRIMNPSRFQRLSLWFLTGFTTIVSIICILVLFTMCDPPKALWKPTLVAEGAKCKDPWILINYAIFTGGKTLVTLVECLPALSAFVDLCLAIYPATVLQKLQMTLRKKIALCAALGLGSVASAMAIIKCTQLKGLADKTDYTYGTAELVIWTKYDVESGVVIIASCIPTLQPLLEIIMGKRSLSSLSNSRNNYKGSGVNDYSHSYERSKLSKASRKQTITTTAVGSQESILADESQHSDNHELSQIRRTDNVTIQYETRSPSTVPEERNSW
ncbi:hypothetical protein ASPZODRAFT_73793 [Penicilliopsis zonata CBS 506.65]|uniref:Rhodopsin domain-containing protein n=1 Tax=Penicilliopsis zonata CBS 506.65 TaxID=1073090 RepID=A0A1L9S910_9EURO|nr:hypothetical protein ASPZODRAFT_73793 [Penicilliopsis zonata CBS 506.65]OJJ43619.1 hypothetical protein ASPZODRAFT_73793 [Penicilliopsis zonata CBS 506.65]